MGNVIQFVLAIYILRGSTRAVTWAQLLNVLSGLFMGAVLFGEGDIVDGVAIVLFQAALVRLLAGRPRRKMLVTCSILLVLALALEIVTLFFDFNA